MPSAKVEVICPECGGSFMRRPSDIKKAVSRSGIWRCQPCALSMRNKANQQPTGARRNNCKGYVEVKTEYGWVFEHRLVYEKASGRKLLPTEIIHHLNGDITDNRIENLAVMLAGAHTQHHKRGTILKAETKAKLSAAKIGKPSPKKLTAEQVLAIRDAYTKGKGGRSAIADAYGITPSMVSHITTRRAWRNV